MTETSQVGLEETSAQPPPARESEEPVPQNRGRDWFLVFLLFSFSLSLLAAVGMAVLVLLAVVLPSFNLQRLTLTFPPTAVPPLQAISGRLTLFHLAVGLLVVALFLAFFFYLIARWRVVRKRFLRPEAGCPACGHETLVRVHRRSKDRLYAWIAIPVRRYHCRDCRWQGLRIHRGAEHFSISSDWEETLANSASDGAPATLPGSSSGEDRAAILGTAFYNGSNEKWNARLRELSVKDKMPPFSLDLDLDDESATGAGDGSPAADGGNSSATDALDADQMGTLPDTQASSSLPESFLEPAPGEQADTGRELPHRQQRHHVVSRGKIAAPFGLNLRARPHSEAELLGLLAPGTHVLLVEQAIGSDGTTWHHVEIDERHGWVLSAFVEGME